jgi:hypothetical protein
MANVTIFGTGNMGTAIADVLTAGGSTVDHIGHADPPGPVDGDIVDPPPRVLFSAPRNPARPDDSKNGSSP